jgi:peptide/nickel transport system substrate-binding protein
LRRRTIALLLLAVTLVFALGAAGCGGDGDGEDTQAGQQDEVDAEATKGGTFRTQTDAFEWTGNFDPTGEYLATYLGLYTNLLGRTLMGYRHAPEAEGNELIPDLAAEEPEISDDGLTYTFTLRDGVMFGPPLSREVTSADVEYAFKRIATPSLVAQYGFYYLGVIEGLQEYSDAGGLSKPANAAKPISGIETPDDKTIVFTLEQPTGDFLYRVAMPAAGPIPEEVAKCFTKAGEYGRFVMSSGPYMVEGSDQLDISSCQSMKALSGFNPNQKVDLVRNPDYDPETDSPDARENNFDRFEMTLNTNAQDIFDRVEAGQLELAYASEPQEVVRRYSTDDTLTERYHINSGDRTWYLTMNLTQPPFDDIHVRKAANWIMDKEGLRRAWGGEPKGEIANHIVPDTMFNGELDDYAPYQTDGDAGDLERAKEEMSQSKYDTDQDGICDAPECKNVLHVTRNTDVWKNMEPVIEQSFEKIGIGVTSREFEDSYTIIQTVKRHVPVSSTPGWGKDYADASTFMVLFDSRSILPEGNVNYSLVGLTPEQAQEVGAKGTTADIPSVNEDIDRCNELMEDERLTCWQDLDKKLMEEIVPWVPYLEANADFVTSENVTKYVFDQNSGDPAWAHLAVDPNASP